MEKRSNILVVIDNGHGTPVRGGGKCSPDGRLQEAVWTREVAQMVSRALTLRGVDCILLTPEETDTELKERVRKVNAWCMVRGVQNVVIVSIHVNAAASDGKWHDARGFSVFVSKGASARSREMAALMTDEAQKRGLSGNRCVPKGKYWEGNFAMVRDTRCPAVLTENGFQDNREDVEFLLSDEGKRVVAELHVEAISKFLMRHGR